VCLRLCLVLTKTRFVWCSDDDIYKHEGCASS
jgi:hypothetical protein